MEQMAELHQRPGRLMLRGYVTRSSLISITSNGCCAAGMMTLASSAGTRPPSPGRELRSVRDTFTHRSRISPKPGGAKGVSFKSALW